MGERRNPCHQRALRRELMQLAPAAAQLAAGLNAGDDQHRDRIGIGLAHGSGDIGHSGAGNNEANPRFAAGARIAVGHEPCTLLMPRRDMSDRRAREATVQLHGVHAGNAKHLLDAISLK